MKKNLFKILQPQPRPLKSQHMNIDFNPILSKKRDFPAKQFFIFANEKQGSSSPQRAVDGKYFINGNFVVSSTKNASQNQFTLGAVKTQSRKSFDKSSAEAPKKPLLPSKLRIIPRQALANAKPAPSGGFANCSPPKEAKTVATVHRARLGLFPERSSLILDPIVRSTFGNSPLTTQGSAKFTRLRIVSRDKTSLEAGQPNTLPPAQK